MSLYATCSKKDPVQPDFDREFRVERDNKCFYCGHHLEDDPAMQRLGSTAKIFFHARCAIEFNLRLMETFLPMRQKRALPLPEKKISSFH